MTEVVIFVVSMVLCMNCGAGDGFYRVLKFPTMQSCEKAAEKIDKTWPDAVPVCLLDPSDLRAETARAKFISDDIERRLIATNVCLELGGMRDYQFANEESCIYAFAGPAYRETNPVPEGFVEQPDGGLPPRR
jgi:hypothetical protein